MSLDLDAIKARYTALRLSIAGQEWRATHHPNGWHVEGEEHPIIRDLRERVVYVGYGRPELAAFIAHARTDVPALVASVERLQAALCAAGVHINTVAAITHGVTTYGDPVSA